MALGGSFGGCGCRAAAGGAKFPPTSEWEKEVKRKFGVGYFWFRWTVERLSVGIEVNRWKPAAHDDTGLSGFNGLTYRQVSATLTGLKYALPDYVFPLTESNLHSLQIWDGERYRPSVPNSASTLRVEAIVSFPLVGWKVRLSQAPDPQTGVTGILLDVPLAAKEASFVTQAHVATIFGPSDLYVQLLHPGEREFLPGPSEDVVPPFDLTVRGRYSGRF